MKWDVPGATFGVVAGLWRYPVKSFQGESLENSEVTENGVGGDRIFGVVERSTDVLLSAKRTPLLLEGAASLVSDSVAELTFGGTTIRSDNPGVHGALSDWLDLDVELRSPKSGRRTIIEMQVDLDDDSQLAEFSTRPGWFFDSCSLNLISTTSLDAARALYPAGAWGVNRFRPNVLIATETSVDEQAIDVEGRPGFVDDDLVGFIATIGSVEITVTKRCDRCVMITRPFGDYARDRALLRTLGRFHGNELGVNSMVNSSGKIKLGDTLKLLRRS